jgi:hypothetical protein
LHCDAPTHDPFFNILEIPKWHAWFDRLLLISKRAGENRKLQIITCHKAFGHSRKLPRMPKVHGEKAVLKIFHIVPRLPAFAGI